MKVLADRRSAKELDRRSVEMGMPELVLMERAALAVAETIRELIEKEDKGRSVLCICGTGNNGGDGLAVTRILTEWGIPAKALIFGQKECYTEQMKVQLHIAESIGVEAANRNLREILSRLSEFHGGILVDAIFGVGLSRPITGEYETLLLACNRTKAYRVAIDVPSGVNCDNGKILGVAFQADLTVTFGVNKVGLVIYPGKEMAGEVVTKDIGFPKKALEETHFPALTYETSDLSSILPERPAYSHKGSFGQVLIVAGSEGMSGACYLSALATYRNGAGLVKIFTPEANRVILQTLLPEAILETYEGDREEALSEEMISVLKESLEGKTDVVVCGPGLGTGARSRSVFRTVMETGTPAKVIDADGIRLLKEYIEERENREFLPSDLEASMILTPHIKELSVLLHREIGETKENIMEIAEDFKKASGILVIKEAKTVVTGRGKCYINQTGNSAMAKGGSGDVLTGVIAALFALSKDAFASATGGVFLHGYAGDLARDRCGVHGVLAREIAEGIKDKGWLKTDS